MQTRHAWSWTEGDWLLAFLASASGTICSTNWSAQASAAPDMPPNSSAHDVASPCSCGPHQRVHISMSP